MSINLIRCIVGLVLMVVLLYLGIPIPGQVNEMLSECRPVAKGPIS